MNRDTEHGAIRSKIKSAWQGFKEFIGRDNVLEVSLGLIISSSFQKIVNSLVSDILLPILSLLPFINRNMSSKFAVLRRGPNYPYNTREQADNDGAITLNYGSFVDALANFFFVGLTLYALAQLYSWASKDSLIKHSASCRYCRKAISEKAMRCPMCTSWLDGREDKETSALAPQEDAETT